MCTLPGDRASTVCSAGPAQTGIVDTNMNSTPLHMLPLIPLLLLLLVHQQQEVLLHVVLMGAAPSSPLLQTCCC